MSLLARLSDEYRATPPSARLKAALLFNGVRYHPALAEAADWAFPNFLQYHLPPGEPAHRGSRLVDMPYLLRMADDTQVRLRIKPDSPFSVVPHENPLGFAVFENDTYITSTTFEPRLPWAGLLTADGTPMRATGLSQHGDMLVLNVAPGCEYFVVPTESGRSRNLSCSFCLYGLPDKRMDPLGQSLFVKEVPESTLARVAEACGRHDTHARHLYLVGGSMLDMAQEGERFVQIARYLAERGLTERYYVTCGSGALPRAQMLALKDAGVRGACFNLEVWDPEQFARVCPGKNQIVGRDRWIASLEEAVDVFGPQEVMSAFVGGVELDGNGAMTDVEAALASNVEAGEYLIPRGVQAVYSLHWKMTGKHRGEEPVYSLDFFLRLNEQLAEVRRRHNRPINQEHFCRRCAYMQLEPDYDYAPTPALPPHDHLGAFAIA